MSGKPDSLPTLIKKLDTQISLFVRLSAADERGMIYCVSCGKIVFWKMSQCCHFIHRSNMATRFHLDNLAPGCFDCNMGNEDVHLESWAHKLGDKSDILRAISRTMLKWTRPELEQMISDYTEKVKHLRKTKHL